MILKPNQQAEIIIEEKVNEVLNDPSYSEPEKESMRDLARQLKEN